jgi:hypothetical protein
LKTAEQYKKLTIREFTRAAEVYETDHAGIYDMCNASRRYKSGESYS